MPLTVKGENTMVTTGPNLILANSGQSTRTTGGGSGGGAHTHLKLEGGGMERGALTHGTDRGFFKGGR
jgi:hypothetical protein